MKNIVLLLLFLSLQLANADEKSITGKVYSETFRTSNTHDGFRAPTNLSGLASSFQKSLKILPESMLVTSVLFLVNSKVGVSEKQKKKLHAIFQKTYLNILKDKQMQGIPSALPYCLSAQSPNYGHYFIYLPAKIQSSTKRIVFLHGYGGNFMFYIYVLKKAFKDSIIIIPSWGSSWSHGNYRYLQQVYADIETKFSIKIKRPVLMAISAGGGFAFKQYNKSPKRFKSLISFATCPYIRTINRMKPDLSIIMICGKYDKRFPWQGIKSRVMQVKAKVNNFKLKLIPDNHFFFLSSQKEWIKFVKENTNLK